MQPVRWCWLGWGWVRVGAVREAVLAVGLLAGWRRLEVLLVALSSLEVMQKAVVVCQGALGAVVGVRGRPGWRCGRGRSAGAEVKAGPGAAGDWVAVRMGDSMRMGAQVGDRMEAVEL